MEASIEEEYNQLLSECSRKLHFEYFLKQEILQKADISKKNKEKSITVKFSNKFLPATLANVGGLMD